MKSLARWILVAISTSTLFGADSPTSLPDQVPFRLHRGYMILVEGSIGTLDNLTFLMLSISHQTDYTVVLLFDLECHGHTNSSS